MAIGKPLDVSYYERALGRKKPKKVKKRKVRSRRKYAQDAPSPQPPPLFANFIPTLSTTRFAPRPPQDPLASPNSRYSYEIEASIRHMKKDVKIMVKKKSPKRMKGPPSSNNYAPKISGFDQQKFFLSKKERRKLSQITTSPVKASTLLPQI
jgi:hypothetical protein